MGRAHTFQLNCIVGRPKGSHFRMGAMFVPKPTCRQAALAVQINACYSWHQAAQFTIGRSSHSHSEFSRPGASTWTKRLVQSSASAGVANWRIA